MRLQVYLSSAFTVGVATFLSATAIAGNLPKEGTFSVTSKGNGTFQRLPPELRFRVGVYDETSVISGDGLFKDMRWRCIAVPDTIVGGYKATGYCAGIDQDGDQVLFRTTSDNGRSSGTSLGGYGKYKGITASYTAVCRPEGSDSGYKIDCDGEGSYKLP